jgi:hypothetical protein
MISDAKLELFVLKNAVITREIREVMQSQKLGNSRGPLEAQADFLVTDYLQQVYFRTLANAARMS